MQLNLTIRNYGVWLTPGFKALEPGNHTPFERERKAAGRLDFYLHDADGAAKLVASVLQYEVGEIYTYLVRTVYNEQARAQYGTGKTVTERVTWAVGLTLKDILFANFDADAAKATLYQDETVGQVFQMTKESGYTLRYGNEVKE
jgi:hypothetical protein